MNEKIEDSVFIYFYGIDTYDSYELNLTEYEEYKGEAFIIYAGSNLKEKNYIGDRSYLETLEEELAIQFRYCDTVFNNIILRLVCSIFVKNE